MQYNLGKLPPIQEHIDEALQFADLVPVTLPPIPNMYDTLGAVYASLGESDPAVLFPLDGNGPDPAVPTEDGYGNCVECMKAHGRTVYAGLVGKRVIPTAPAVVKQYLAETKGKDSGLNISNSLDNWIANGSFGEKPTVKVFIDPSNWDHVRLAAFLFKYLHTGVSCTDDMQTAFRNGQVWTGSGNVLGGHGVGIPSYGLTVPKLGDNLLPILTWGGILYATKDALTQVDEMWIVASQEMIQSASRFCPEFTGNLLDAMQAIADQR
jgi:hypothetical protein